LWNGFNFGNHGHRGAGRGRRNSPCGRSRFGTRKSGGAKATRKNGNMSDKTRSAPVVPYLKKAGLAGCPQPLPESSLPVPCGAESSLCLRQRMCHTGCFSLVLGQGQSRPGGTHSLKKASATGSGRRRLIIFKRKSFTSSVDSAAQSGECHRCGNIQFQRGCPDG